MNTEEITLQNLKNKLKSKAQLYEFLSSMYQLPSFNSKAISPPYLKAYLISPIKVVRMLRNDYHPPYLEVKHFTVKDILSKIKELLQRQGKKPTGLTVQKPLDTEWLIGVYHFLSPNDEMNLFPKSIKPETQIHLKIDPE